MFRYPCRTYYLQKKLNVLVSVGILLFLSGLAIHYYGQVCKKARVLAHVASTDQTRLAISYYHALTGGWPENAEQLRTGFEVPRLFQGYSNSEVTVDRGALQIPLVAGMLAGKAEVTVHPAVPVSDPVGPVHWVVGAGGNTPWHEIIGPDRSEVANELIVRDLR